jgi:Ca-activated chloride channel homolog
MDQTAEKGVFELANPWVLCALPLPWLIWLLVKPSPRISTLVVKIPFLHLLQNTKIKLSQKAFNNITRVIYWFIIWALLLLALSGPRWIGQPEPLMREGYNIMLALDISPSMGINDMVWNRRAVSRFQIVQYTAMRFVQERSEDRIGLILFGERAFLLTPLTYDHQTVLHRLEDATVGLAGKSTSIGDALGIAIKRLQSVPQKGRVIILLTDGVNNSGVIAPLKAAELAKTEKIKVYTIGLGAPDSINSLDQAFFNRMPQAELDEQTLQQISQITHGQYFRATSLKSLEQIYQRIHQIEKISQDQTSARPQHEYYIWPLAVAWFLWFFDLIYRHLLFLWRRRW